MWLPIGPWDLDANGSSGMLDIESVDDDGDLKGVVLGDNILGFWDKDAQKITFVRFSDPQALSTYQIYTGYFWKEPKEPPTKSFPSGSFDAFLAGSFEAFQGTGGVAHRHVFGWTDKKSVAVKKQA